MEAGLQVVGRVTHFYPKISVAVVELSGPLSIGDKIMVRGSTTNLEQEVESMEIEHRHMTRAEAGKPVGLKVRSRVRENDLVYKRA